MPSSQCYSWAAQLGLHWTWPCVARPMEFGQKLALTPQEAADVLPELLKIAESRFSVHRVSEEQQIRIHCANLTCHPLTSACSRQRPVRA